MNNKKKSILVLSIGMILVLNISGSMIAIHALTKTVEVIVVSETLGPRSMIESKHVSVISMPKNTVPTNVFLDESDVVGKFVSFDASLYRGMFFFVDAIESIDTVNDAPLLRLKEGQVAVSIGVDVLKSIGNTLLPGQYVDLVHTFVIRNGNPIVDTIFNDVRVLAIKDRYGLDMSDSKSQKVPHVILLAINHSDANDFYLALRKGQMDLVPLPSGRFVENESTINKESIIWRLLYE